jgi:hypothetical protein
MSQQLGASLFLVVVLLSSAGGEEEQEDCLLRWNPNPNGRKMEKRFASKSVSSSRVAVSFF